MMSQHEFDEKTYTGLVLPTLTATEVVELLTRFLATERFDVVDSLLDQGVDVNIRDEYGSTLLSALLDFAGVEYLVSKGINVNTQDNQGNTPLYQVAMLGSLEAVQSLVSHGADVNARNAEGRTPLHVAADTNFSAKVLAYLISQNADVNAKDEEYAIPLDVADTEVKKRLLREAMAKR